MAEDVQKISGTYAKAAARLCNFETGKSYLLLAHQDFLDNDVRNVIQKMQGPWVDLFGYASRAGDAGFNMNLSDQRIKAVRARIEQYANQVNFQIHQALGETQSGLNERNNDGYYRAVEIYVYASKPPTPVPPAPKPSLRRLTFRSFSKTVAQSDSGGGQPNLEKDAINELLKLGLSALQGKLTAEGLLGSETARRVSEIPSDHRVNKMISNQKRSLDTFVGGSTVQQDTDLTYEWGPPTPMVVVETRFQFTWGEKVNPPINETRFIPRKQAEAIPLIVPPDP